MLQHGNIRRVAVDKKQSLVQYQKRAYQYYGSKTYQTGFERMIQDKFVAIPGLSSISWFALLGVFNLGGYALS